MNQLEKLIHSIHTARRMTIGLLEGISIDDWLHQPIAGGQHVAWIVGHLTIADDWGLVALGQQRYLTHLDHHFHKDRPITSDSHAYPPTHELREAFDSAHDRFLHRLSEIADSDLDRPTSGPIADFAPDLGTLLASHVWHEGFHAGQLALIRRSLALPVRWG